MSWWAALWTNICDMTPHCVGVSFRALVKGSLLFEKDLDIHSTCPCVSTCNWCGRVWLKKEHGSQIEIHSLGWESYKQSLGKLMASRSIAISQDDHLCLSLTFYIRKSASSTTQTNLNSYKILSAARCKPRITCWWLRSVFVRTIPRSMYGR